MSKKNIGPFQVGGIVAPPFFIGRDKELKGMYESLRTLSQNFLVIAPRRVGKSSLLNFLKRKLENKKNIIVIYLNCRNITNKSNLSTKLIEVFLSEYEKKHKLKGFLEIFKRAMKDKILSTIRKLDQIGGSIGDIGEVYIKFREKEIDEQVYLEKTLDFIEKFSKEKEIRTIILIDEFQKLNNFNDAIFDLFKSELDIQKRVRYVVTGSSLMLLQDILLRKDSPLYMMFTKIYLEPFDQNTTTDFVKKRLNKFNIKISQDGLKYIHECTGGIPYYVQKLGQFCFELSQLTNKSVDKYLVQNGFERMLREFDEEFESRFLEKFSPKRQAILIEIANRDGARVSEIAHAMGVDVNFLGESMHFLVESMVLQKQRRGYYDFFDKVFKAWLSRDM